MTTRTRSPVTAYAEEVTAGRVLCNKLVRQAAERHLRDLETGHLRGLYFDEQAADLALAFFGFLRHYKGKWAGQPLILEPWQQFIVGSIFGWKGADDGLRRFRNAYIEIPRKNGKSLLAAGIGLLLAFFDGEGGAEVYAAATKRDQAKIVWGDAKMMVAASTALRNRITSLTNNLNNPRTASKFEPLGADGDSMDGLNIHGAIVDELHAHKQRRIWDVIATATGARSQPLIFAITTAGFDRLTVCWEQHHYCEQVLGQIVDDDTLFAYIATIDEGDDWTDPETWRKANPNYGVSVNIDDLQRKCDRAKAIPGEVNAFLRLHLDVWTEQATRWLPMDAWDECAGPLTHEEMRAELAGRECWAGADLSNRIDLTCITLWFPGEDGSVDVLTFPFVPEDRIFERSQRDRVPYDHWRDQGFITATEGSAIDQAFIRDFVNDLAAEFQIREVGFDPFTATQFAIQLGQDGLTCVPIRQGFLTLTEPTKELERLVVTRKIRHGGHPVLRWAASNVAVSTDPAGNIKPDKAHSTERIDPIASLVNAGARALVYIQQEVNDWHGIYIPGMFDEQDGDDGPI